MNHPFRTITSLCAAAILSLSGLTGCGAKSESKSTEIVTTVYAVYDMAKQLTAETETPVTVKLLLTPGGESHSYEPTPSDTATVQRCALFAYIGGESEQWADKLIESSRNGKQNLKLMDSVSLLTEETVEGMEEDEDDHDEAHDHDHDASKGIDEHIWTSPLNADAMLTALRDAVKLTLPDDSAKIDAAYAPLHEKYLALDSEAKDICDSAKNNTLIFADRFPFRYLTSAYGWKYYAAFSGCSSDTDASAATLSFLISKVKELDIKTVFYLENSSKKISDAVCRATGAEACEIQSGNNVSAEDFKAGKHYQDIMAENLAAIRKALN